jgi:alpha-sarcoglycan
MIMIIFYSYRAMLKSKATLPSWLTYQPIIKDQVHSIYPNIHAKFHKEFLEINRTRIRSSISGFIYGTPPLSYAQKTFEIEVVGVNKKTYETRVAIIKFKVSKNLEPVNRVELKIANMNWYEVIETKEDLKRVFTDGLWNESRRDLTMTFMQSAVKMGSRYPIKPHSHEGVVVVFGSNAPLSDILIELKDEIEPLKKLSTCTYKKSKHQMKFETIKKTKLIIDWCAVKILNENDRTPSVESKIEEASFVSQKIWIAPTKEELPERNYSEEIAVSIAIPSVVLAFLVALLTIVLCFQHEEL